MAQRWLIHGSGGHGRSLADAIATHGDRVGGVLGAVAGDQQNGVLNHAAVVPELAGDAQLATRCLLRAERDRVRAERARIRAEEDRTRAADVAA